MSDIEITYNPDQLNIRRKYKVSNARYASKQIERFMAVKRPRGLRVRHGEDIVSNMITLETRDAAAMTCITGFLRDSGIIRRT
jgi:hypothetical protein